VLVTAAPGGRTGTAASDRAPDADTAGPGYPLGTEETPR
jgi:hypothetical protein